MTDPYTPELRRELPITGDAFGPRYPCKHRARILGLGLSVGIAIARIAP